MEVTWAILCILLSLLLMWLFRYTRRGRSRLPPGPRGLPLLGSFLDISSSNLHEYSTKLSKVYGDVISINILGETCVVLNSLDVLREALYSEKFATAFSGRPLKFLQYTNNGRNSTSFVPPSPAWAKQRKMLHKTLKMYGEGVKEMELTVQQELTNVVEWISAKNGEKFKLSDILYLSLLNIIAILLVGRRFEYDSSEIQKIVAIIVTGFGLGAPWKDKLLNLFPFLLRIPVGIGREYALFYEAEKQYDEEFYHKQKATYDPAVTRGLVDVMLRTREESLDEHGTAWLTEDKIKAISGEMIAAGIPCLIRRISYMRCAICVLVFSVWTTIVIGMTNNRGVQTTHATLRAIFLILLYHPEVSDRIADEVEKVIGESRPPRLSDRAEMPYTEAAILEALRLISNVPLALPHNTTCDVEFRDFLIPANTTVYTNYWAVHHDDSLWDNPWEFKPERFLNDDGKIVSVDHVNRRNVMPFSIGKRSCVGEVFAKSRIFLFIATLFQHFTFEAAGDETLPSCDPRDFTGAIVIDPAEYWIIAKPRE